MAYSEEGPTGPSFNNGAPYGGKIEGPQAIWIQSGGTHGHQEADWRQAREDLGVPPRRSWCERVREKGREVFAPGLFTSGGAGCVKRSAGHGGPSPRGTSGGPG